jgi:hypothetical protein
MNTRSDVQRIWWSEGIPVTGRGDVETSTFRRNMTPPFSGSKNKPSSLLAMCFILVSCLAYPSTLKDGDMSPRNIGCFSTDYTALYPRR